MERRNRRRVETFMMKTRESGFTPIYIFSQSDSESIPGLILDVSEGGCKLLLPKNRQSISSKIQLKIQESEQLTEQLIEIDVEQSWCDPDYSIEHEAVGLRFADPHHQTELINQLIGIFVDRNENEQFVICELMSPGR